MKKGIGFKIKLARTEAGLTQVQLGQKLSTSHSVIATWEGGRFMPNQDSLKKISEALNKPVAYFFDYEEDKNGNTKNLHLVKDSSKNTYDANTVNIPVIDVMPNNLPFYTANDISAYIEFPRFMFPGVKFAVKADSISLEPHIGKGDYCLIKPESPNITGKTVFVKTVSGYEFLIAPKSKTAKDSNIVGEVAGVIKKLS